MDTPIRKDEAKVVLTAAWARIESDPKCAIDELAPLVPRLRASAERWGPPYLASALLARGQAYQGFKRYADALADFDDAIAEAEGADPDDELSVTVNSALYCRARTLEELGETEQAVSAYRLVVDRCSPSEPDPRISATAAEAAYRLGYLHAATGRSREASAAWGELVDRFGKTDDPETLVIVAATIGNQTKALRETAGPAASLRSSRSLTERFAGSHDPRIHATVSEALRNHATDLELLGRSGDAEALLTEVVVRCREAPDPELETHIACSALVEHGRMRDERGDAQTAIQLFEQAIIEFGSSPSPRTIEQVAFAKTRKAFALSKLDDLHDALALVEEVERDKETQYETFPGPDFYARALHVILLAKLGRGTEAEETYAALEAEYGSVADPAVREYLTFTRAQLQQRG
jgi:tetratricopeptide (TPR) repeat protein